MVHGIRYMVRGTGKHELITWQKGLSRDSPDCKPVNKVNPARYGARTRDLWPAVDSAARPRPHRAASSVALTYVACKHSVCW